LEDYGIIVHADSVVRTTYYYKYLHPKEVFISHGVLQPDLVIKKHLFGSGGSSGGSGSIKQVGGW